MIPTLRRLALPMLVSAAVFGPAHADTDTDELQNWFNDPFFQISSGMRDCPVPAGPFVSESDRRVQAHRRAEKGTTCWLARECDRPNAYAYDADIAAELKAALRERNPFEATSLWVTVQGRVVYVEGCVTRASQEAEIEAFVRSLPHVQQALAIVRSDPSTRPPYRLRHPA
jgi:hypothetical protein